MDTNHEIRKEFESLKEKIEILETQVNFLEKRVIHLENINLGKDIKLNHVSDANFDPLNTNSQNQQYNLSPTQNKAPNQSNFLPLSQILEKEKIEIIKLGFQLQSQEKISLKKYYEGTEEYSLFKSKGYSIKYDSVRKTKLYLKLKEESF